MCPSWKDGIRASANEAAFIPPDIPPLLADAVPAGVCASFERLRAELTERVGT